MANGVSGTKGGGTASGSLSAAKVSELESLHQKTLDSLKNSQGGDDWDRGYETGARYILSRLTGKDYSVSDYQLKQTGSSNPMSISEVESLLDGQIKDYEQTNHSSWNEGYYSAAVKMLENATGNKYSVSGYKLTKVSNPTTSQAQLAKPKAKKAKTSTGGVTGQSLVTKLNSNTSNATKLAIKALRYKSSDSVTDKNALAASINKTLQKANSSSGVSSTFFNDSKRRTSILKVLGSGYEFVENKTTTPGNWYTMGLPTTSSTWSLRKKKS